MHFSSLLTLLPLVLAAPIQLQKARTIPRPLNKRIVQPSNCTAVTAGVLTGGAIADHPQSFWVEDDVLQYGAVEPGVWLEVVFQRCDPNFENFPQNSTLLSGHMYIPALNACLSVDPPNGPPPHVMTAEPCARSDDSRQILQQWWQVNGTSGVEYVWAGFTDNRGNVQNGAVCPSGTFGYAAGSDLANPPNSGNASIVCTSDEGAQVFRIVPQASD